MLINPENSPSPREHTNEALNFLKTDAALCNDNVDTWLYKVHCVSGTFNELGDPAGGTMPLTFPTSALWCNSVFSSAEVSGDELSIRIVLIVDVLKLKMQS